MTRDWVAWHADYDADTPLVHRLRAVQHWIRRTLDDRPPGAIRFVSLCAGEGRDILEVLADHPRATDAVGRLIELDPELAARARSAAPSGVTVERGDAGRTEAFVGAVPADLVLVCGVFGNLSDDDIERTVRALPSLCAAGATVIWTRHRRPPDLTVAIREWFLSAGFELVGFEAPADFVWSVGIHRLVGDPVRLVPGRRLFSFVHRA
jgi:hypothetical protein